MLTLEPEIAGLAKEGRLSPEAAAALIARERREVVPVGAEVRTAAWLGVMLIVTGVGIIISKNLDRIGPMVVALAILGASLACYGWAAWRRSSRAESAVDPYVLLLGALLLSADAGYVEHQFHLLGGAWARHFLILAVIHGAGAYWFDSRALLSLSISSLAAWLGVEQRPDAIFDNGRALAVRAFTASGVVLAWMWVHGRVRPKVDFRRVFEHFAAMLALTGGLALTFDSPTREIGAPLTIAVAGLVIWYGFRVSAESFVLYAFAAGLMALHGVVIPEFRGSINEVLWWLLVSTLAAIAALFVIHGRFKRGKR